MPCLALDVSIATIKMLCERECGLDSVMVDSIVCSIKPRITYIPSHSDEVDFVCDFTVMAGR